MKAGAYLKPLMVQCALAAIACKKNPYFAIKYRRIKSRRGHKKAIIAIARMMMVSIYHMVKDKQPFSPCDYEELLNPQEHPQRVVLNDANVFDYLNAQGYDTCGVHSSSVTGNEVKVHKRLEIKGFRR